MERYFTFFLIAFGFLFCALPGRAQDAYASVTQPADAVASNPQSSPKSAATSAATKVVHGVVQGRDGVLPGATVWLHGSRTIAVTNAEGEFELRVPADAKTMSLTYSYGGLREEVVTLVPVQALGSLYLLRASNTATARPIK